MISCFMYHTAYGTATQRKIRKSRMQKLKSRVQKLTRHMQKFM